jgi:hypothetical protein
MDDALLLTTRRWQVTNQKIVFSVLEDHENTFLIENHFFQPNYINVIHLPTKLHQLHLRRQYRHFPNRRLGYPRIMRCGLSLLIRLKLLDRKLPSITPSSAATTGETYSVLDLALNTRP